MQLDEAKQMPPRQKKNVVVAIGRFNPPTIGHYHIIDAMKAFIRKNDRFEAMPVVVIIEGAKSKDDHSRNPLTGSERQAFMESSGRANNVKFMIASSAADAFEKVRLAGFEPMAIAAGSDRVAGYKGLLDGYFTEDGHSVKDGGKKIDREFVPGLERDADADDSSGDDYYQKIIDMVNDGEKLKIEMVSGSLARYAVRNGEKKAFSHIVGLASKPKLADKMFSKIEGALGGDKKSS